MNYMNPLPDLIDTRRMRKQAKVLLKSRSFDKIFRSSLGTSLKTSYLQSNEDMHSSEILTSLGESVPRPSSSAKQDKVMEECWDVFTRYARPIGDCPFDRCQLCLSAENVDNALNDLNQRGISVLMTNDYSNERVNTSLSWGDFKSLITRHIRDGDGKILKDDSSIISDSKIRSRSYDALIQRQRSVSQVVYDDIPNVNAVSTHLITTVPQSNRLYPVTSVKDAAIKLSRKETLVSKMERSICCSSSNQEHSFIGDSVLNSSTATNNETSNVFPHNKPFDHERPFVNLTEKQRLTGIFNEKEEYPSKWLAMKKHRDERRAREHLKTMRQSALYSSRQIVNLAERSELDRIKDEAAIARENEIINNKIEQDKHKSLTKLNILKRWELDQNRKHYEAQYLRDVIVESTEMMRQLHHEEIEAIREVNRQNMYELDSSTSSIVEIPMELQQRLKQAKSLIQFNSAKRDIRTYFEQTMSSRMAALQKKKRIAMIATTNADMHISKPTTSLKSQTMFTDSISLHTDSVDDKRGGEHTDLWSVNDEGSWISDQKELLPRSIGKKKHSLHPLPHSTHRPKYK